VAKLFTIMDLTADMSIILIVSLLLNFGFSAQGQAEGINLSDYLKPKADTLFYNSIYNSFHASGRLSLYKQLKNR